MNAMNYFLLSDVAKPVKIKISSLRSKQLAHLLAIDHAIQQPLEQLSDDHSNARSTQKTKDESDEKTESTDHESNDNELSKSKSLRQALHDHIASNFSSSTLPLQFNALHSSSLSSLHCCLYVTCHIYSRGQPQGTCEVTQPKCFPPDSIANLQQNQPPPPSSSSQHQSNNKSTQSQTTPIFNSTSSSSSTTSFASVSQATSVKFNEWLTFPLQYKDLSPTSRFVITVWRVSLSDALDPSEIQADSLNFNSSSSSSSTDQKSHRRISATPFGGTCMPLFNKRGLLKLGRRKLQLHFGRQGDGSQSNPHQVNAGQSSSSSTPHNAYRHSHALRESNVMGMSVTALESRIRHFDQRPLAQVKWLDKLALKRIERLQSQAQSMSLPILERALAMHQQSSSSSTSAQSSQYLSSSTVQQYLISSLDSASLKLCFLTVEFPPFAHPIVYHQRTSNATHSLFPPSQRRSHAEQLNQSEANSSLMLRSINSSNLDFAPDEFGVQAVGLMIHDPECVLENPIQKMNHKLASRELYFGGNVRSLKPSLDERRALNSILHNPSNKRLSVESKELIYKFRYSLIDNRLALNPFLRCIDWTDEIESSEALSLLNQWTVSDDISSTLELLGKDFRNSEIRNYAVRRLESVEEEELTAYLLQLVQALRYEAAIALNYTTNAAATQSFAAQSTLAHFLLHRCIKSLQLTNFFYWYLFVETFDRQRGAAFANLLNEFMSTLKRVQPQLHDDMIAQAQLIQQLSALSDSVNSTTRKERFDKKLITLQQLLSPQGEFGHLTQFAQTSNNNSNDVKAIYVRMSVRPEVCCSGVAASQCSMFKSALSPLLLCFNTIQPHSSIQPSASIPQYRVLFKKGDDLRQDQLVIQIINLMDSLLKKVKLDLQLTPYRVLATSTSTGFVEFIDSSYTLTSILDKYDRNIMKFFQFHNSKPAVLSRVLDTFIRSCSGYCVITYLLGIGDRHFDNVLLCSDGHLCHIDFSYLFGRDPKPFPPPMKFSAEMVECMGGATSDGYHQFRKHCMTAFNLLRQHAHLILNLLELMTDANIPDLSIDSEAAINKVEQKFRLDLTDEEAGHFILQLIDQSVSALFPQVMEKIHKWALYWK